MNPDQSPLFDVSVLLPLTPAAPVAAAPPVVIKPLAELLPAEVWVFAYLIRRGPGAPLPGRLMARRLKHDPECVDFWRASEEELARIYRHRKKPKLK